MWNFKTDANTKIKKISTSFSSDFCVFAWEIYIADLLFWFPSCFVPKKYCKFCILWYSLGKLAPLKIVRSLSYFMVWLNFGAQIKWNHHIKDFFYIGGIFGKKNFVWMVKLLLLTKRKHSTVLNIKVKL